MGIDYVLFERLVDLSTRFRPEGRTLMLGRQKFPIERRVAKFYETALRKAGIDDKRFSFLQDDGFAETLMSRLGFGQMEAMDFSDYEGAAILHDLNQPVPEELQDQFSLILDGGTLEHVFNLPQALRNVFAMLKPGGRFVGMNPLNGWPGHGLYQFNPELVWTFWRRTCGCEVVDCRGIAKWPDETDSFQIPFSDPAESGHRLRFRNVLPEGRVYLYYEVEKTEGAQLADDTLQSDYETKWHGHEQAGATRLDGAQA